MNKTPAICCLQNSLENSTALIPTDHVVCGDVIYEDDRSMHCGSLQINNSLEFGCFALEKHCDHLDHDETNVGCIQECCGEDHEQDVLDNLGKKLSFNVVLALNFSF